MIFCLKTTTPKIVIFFFCFHTNTLIQRRELFKGETLKSPARSIWNFRLETSRFYMVYVHASKGVFYGTPFLNIFSSSERWGRIKKCLLLNTEDPRFKLPIIFYDLSSRVALWISDPKRCSCLTFIAFLKQDF